MTDSDASSRLDSVRILQESHRSVVERAIKRTISTNIAQEIYAQIVDGLPTREAIFDTRGLPPSPGHPIETAHDELCDGVLHETRKIYDDFDLESLKFESRVCLLSPASGR